LDFLRTKALIFYRKFKSNEKLADIYGNYNVVEDKSQIQYIISLDFFKMNEIDNRMGGGGGVNIFVVV